MIGEVIISLGTDDTGVVTISTPEGGDCAYLCRLVPTPGLGGREYLRLDLLEERG